MHTRLIIPHPGQGNYKDNETDRHGAAAEGLHGSAAGRCGARQAVVAAHGAFGPQMQVLRLAVHDLTPQTERGFVSAVPLF